LDLKRKKHQDARSIRGLRGPGQKGKQRYNEHKDESHLCEGDPEKTIMTKSHWKKRGQRRKRQFPCLPETG